MEREIRLSRIESDLDTVESTHRTVRSYGILFGLLWDADTDELLGVGFEARGRLRTFFRARDAMGQVLEAGGERGGIYHLDHLLESGLALTEEAQVRFRAAWDDALDVFAVESHKNASPAVIPFREALRLMRPEARGTLSGYVDETTPAAVGEVHP